MKPHSKKGFICLKMMMKIPMTVFGGLQCNHGHGRIWLLTVSIPMTVFGGLQFCLRRISFRPMSRFNTDDGIWRATITGNCVEYARKQESFNTDDGIWRATIRYFSYFHAAFACFNTDDGIWRATITNGQCYTDDHLPVSIPMTVFGGLQFSVAGTRRSFSIVSIPMTVFGGLQ